MIVSGSGGRRRWLTLRYSLVACLGFVTDVILLKLGIHFGLSPAAARCISLFCAMQVTFTVNGLLVFRCLRADAIHLQWGGYMATNSVGNLANYLTFTTLLSLHMPVVSNHLFAVAVGGLIAWVINFTCTRLVFGDFERPASFQRASPPVLGLARTAPMFDSPLPPRTRP